MAGVPRLKILHYTLDGDLVQQHEVADADVVVVRHLSCGRNARNESQLLYIIDPRELHRERLNRHKQPPRATDPRALTVDWRACFVDGRLLYLDSSRSRANGKCGHLRIPRVSLPHLRSSWLVNDESEYSATSTP